MDILTFIGIIMWGIIIYFVGKAVYKQYILAPKKAKQIGLFKFREFKDALQSYNIENEPIEGNEYILTFREPITNGVDKIGYFKYSAHDYIKFVNNEKQHNYYLSVSVFINTLFLEEKSNYFSDFTFDVCKRATETLKNRIINNEQYKKIFQLQQLR